MYTLPTHVMGCREEMYVLREMKKERKRIHMLCFLDYLKEDANIHDKATYP